MALQKTDLYRLPWSKNDNPIAWLEVTDICNLRCEGCYRHKMTGHKPLEQVQEEILFYKEWRNPDNVSIAGGEPLLHPEFMDIVDSTAAVRANAYLYGYGSLEQLQRELDGLGTRLREGELKRS